MNDKISSDVKIVMCDDDVSVTVGGNDVTRVVQTFAVSGSAGRRPHVELHLVPAGRLHLDLDDADVTVSDPTYAALRSLGWTPPA